MRVSSVFVKQVWEPHGLFQAYPVTIPVLSSPAQRLGWLCMLAKPLLRGFEGEKPLEPSCEPTVGPGSTSTLSSKGMQLKQKRKRKKKTPKCGASPFKDVCCHASVLFLICEGMAREYCIYILVFTDNDFQIFGALQLTTNPQTLHLPIGLSPQTVFVLPLVSSAL